MDDILENILSSIKKRKIEGNIGDLTYQLGSKNLQAQAQINDATIRALLGYDGSWKLNANSPLLGGNLNLEANHNDSNNNLSANYQRQLLGGDLSLDASRNNGNNRFYLQYKKTF